MTKHREVSAPCCWVVIPRGPRYPLSMKHVLESEALYTLGHIVDRDVGLPGFHGGFGVGSRASA